MVKIEKEVKSEWSFKMCVEQKVVDWGAIKKIGKTFRINFEWIKFE